MGISDKYHCLKPDHDVLTKEGWKPIAEVTLSDEVACLENGENLVYQHPTEIMHYPNFKGKMYHIKNEQIDLDVTENHRMLVQKQLYLDGKRNGYDKPSLEKASEIIGKHRKYKKNALWEKPVYQFILPEYKQFQAKVLDMNSWLTLFGIMLSCAVTSQKEIQIAVNSRIKRKVITILSTLEYTYSQSIDPLREDIIISDEQLVKYANEININYYNCCLPDWVWDLNKEQARLLMKAVAIGNIGRDNASRLRIFSKDLLDDLQRLCLHAGWSANKTIYYPIDNKTIIRGKCIDDDEVYELMINRSNNSPSVNNHHKQEECLYDFEGPVYCIGVPSQVFYVRRNGKPIWTGNSRETGPVQLLTRQPAEGRSRDKPLSRKVSCH